MKSIKHFLVNFSAIADFVKKTTSLHRGAHYTQLDEIYKNFH